MRFYTRAAKTAGIVWLTSLAGVSGCTISGDMGPQTQQDDSRGREVDRVRPAAASIPPARDSLTDPARPVPAPDPSRIPVAGLRYSLAYPTGARASSVLLLEADGPKEVRVGHPFTYTLRVTNLTGSPLHGVSVYALSNDLVPVTPHAGTLPSEPSTGRAPRADAATPARQDSTTWSVGTLAPRETRSHQVESVGDEVGVLSRCLGVTYTPTLCTTVNVVRPELQIKKDAPAEILLCQELNYRYTVTNIGTGTAEAVRVTDTLADGLATQGGQKVVSLDLGDLPQGQSKSTVVKIRPARTGQFSSRANAKSGDANGDSGEVATVVREPVLAIAVDGPEARYANEAVDFKVTVRNTGDAAALATVVHLSSPDVAERFADRDLGVIEPGGSKTVTVGTHAGAQAGEQRLIATADATCTRTTSARGTVAVRTIPALLLECGDSIDPVRVGNSTVYTITVVNQGSGADTNVAVKAIVPAEEQYVASIGASEATVDGQTLTFAPVASLAPKQTVQWKVEVKGAKAGDARFNVELTSDSLTRPATKSESTRVVDDAVPAARKIAE